MFADCDLDPPSRTLSHFVVVCTIYSSNRELCRWVGFYVSTIDTTHKKIAYFHHIIRKQFRLIRLYWDFEGAVELSSDPAHLFKQ